MADDFKIEGIEKVLPDVSKVIPASRRKKREKNSMMSLGTIFFLLQSAVM